MRYDLTYCTPYLKAGIASFCSGAGYICNAGVQEEKVIQIPLLQEVWNVSESRY